MEQAYAQMRRKMRMSQLDKEIKHKIMVLSGKGGVGKSTVSVGLALSLARQGKKVGLMDIDITGPNVPKMLGVENADLHVEDGQIFPVIGPHGVKVISMAFLIEDPDKPVIWRGPIKLGAIQQFIGDVAWGELDALIIDFPPGTSDEPLTVSQSLHMAMAIVSRNVAQFVAFICVVDAPMLFLGWDRFTQLLLLELTFVDLTILRPGLILVVSILGRLWCLPPPNLEYWLDPQL